MPERRKTTTLLMQGFLIDYDRYNRVKIMFLDDYDVTDKLTFTKSYITNKKTEGTSPLSTDKKHFFVKCKAGAVGLIESPQIKLVPIQELIQHKVECVVRVNEFKFYVNGAMQQGWNLQLKNIRLLEH